MKPLSIITALLLILSVTTLTVMSVDINKEKDTVTIKENVIYGDKAQAYGLSVTSNLHYDNHLFWSTVYTVSNAPRINTEYSFYHQAQYRNSETHPGITVSSKPSYGCNFKKPAEEQSGLAKAYKELFDMTAPGEDKRAVIQLNKYYEYYPISVFFDIPDVYFSGNDPDNLTGDHVGGEKYVHDKFAKYFRIPIPDTEKVEIYVAKDITGNISMSGAGGAYSDELELEAESYYATSVCAYGSGRCYFTVSNNTKKDNRVDMSLIPGGYGIYSFRYSEYKMDKGVLTTGIDADSLSTVYQLDTTVTVEEMWLSDNGSRLHLMTYEAGGRIYYTLIDTASMTAMQHILISETGFISNVYHRQEDFLAITVEDKITVLEKTSDGNYNVEFTVPMSDILGERIHWFHNALVMDYNGEKLAIAGALYESKFHSLELCNYYIAVYDKNGLSFYAEYISSLSLNPDPSRFKGNCLPDYPNAFEIKWNT